MALPPLEILEKYKHAGKIANTALRQGAEMIVVGATVRDVLDKVERIIADMGGQPAFPAQISLNATAAHFCPTDEDDEVFSLGDVVKIDVGVHIDGYVADNAMTVDLGNNAGLVQASKDALEAALKLATPGRKIGEIGRAIHHAIQAHGLSPIKNLSGHGLGRYQIHTSPSIPNFDTHDDTELVEGQVIAIEPFASTGAGEIFESGNPTIYSLVGDRPVRQNMTREVLRSIKEYGGLPFTTRWLTRKHGLGKTRFALKELTAVGNIIAHPPLPDKGQGLVSQHEHSVIVANPPIVYTRDY